MVSFLNVYILDPQKGLKKTAVLQNAFSITETQELNKIYTLDFSIPAADEKTKYIQPFHYVRYGDKGQLYRIIKINYEDSDKSILNVSCEHVIAVLCDELMFGAVKDGGADIRTADVITNLLNLQTVKNWKLASCSFDRKFEYLWEQENILNALYSIPKEFTKAYKWTFDTTKYPWELSLEEINAAVHPEYYIRAKRNLLSSGTNQDFAGICTRIYPLGYGEGVNQLTIKDALVDKNTGEVDTENGEKWGQPFIESPDEITDLYGIKEKVLVDRRFENAESLYTYGKTMLEGLQTPSMSRSFDVVDLYPLTSQDIDAAEVGKICRMTGDGTTAYITKTTRVLDEPGSLQIELSTKATDVASTIADLADRVRIESVYAQGATQLYQHSKDANATTTKGMVMSLYFPSEMRQINKVLMRLKLGRFRSYSDTTDAGGATTRTSSEGGSSKQTSSAGGSSKQTSSSGGSSNPTSSAGGAYTETTDAGGNSTATSSSGGNSTATSSSGGGTGTTSTNSGGPSISFSAEATETANADWTPFVISNNGNSNCDTSGTAVDGSTNQSGNHSHSLLAETGEVTPPSSLDYKHYHAINYLNGALENGKHNHDFTSNWHNHEFSVYKLKHTHSVSIRIKNNDNNQSDFNHSHTFSIGAHTHSVDIPSHTHNVTIPSHRHKLNIPNHTHTVNIPSHTHTVDIPNHTHTVDIPSHTHTVTIPNHTHKISPGIFESGNPMSFDIYVSGKKKTTVNTTSYNGDITAWLLDSKNQIQRDTWIDVEIRPNDLAYVQCSVFVQGFVQSRGGGNY